MPARSLRPLAPAEFDYWKARLLLSRAGFGGTPAQVRALTDMGLHAAVEHLVDYAGTVSSPAGPDGVDRDIIRALSPQERQELRRARQTGDEATVERFRAMRQQAQRADRQQIGALQEWWLAQMVETTRPLEEKMTLFWHGHFATNYRAIEDSYHMSMQNELFRANAAGNIKGLTHGIIRDPAMLRYLNSDDNRKEQPNENLARELMELFTLGEGHEYTEDDIKEGARALTGYTFRDDAFVDPGSPEYRHLHDAGAKRILGRTGAWDGDDFVEIIFAQRACSEFLCLKLYRYFVNDSPGGPDEARRQFITDLARELRENRYQLRPVLKTLFASEHFYDPSNVASQIKSPVQLIVQSIRTLGTPARDYGVLLGASDLMGQNLFHPPSVKGWEGGRSWINTSTMFVRQNTIVYLLTGRRPESMRRRDDGADAGVRDGYDATHLISHLRGAGGEAGATEAVTYLLRFNLGAEPRPERVGALVEFVESRGGRMTNDLLIAILALITAMPEYQLC